MLKCVNVFPPALALLNTKPSDHVTILMDPDALSDCPGFGIARYRFPSFVNFSAMLECNRTITVFVSWTDNLSVITRPIR